MPAKHLGQPEVDVPAGSSMMSSARERPEAESQLQEEAPPRVRESSQEVAASAEGQASRSVQWLAPDGGAFEH